MGHALPTFALALALLTATPFVAAAQVADPECAHSPSSTAETLIADLAAIPLPQGCSTIEPKKLAERVKDTPHIGLFTKIGLGLRAKAMLDDAKAYDRSKKQADLVKLRATYRELFKDFAEKLEGKDPELIRDLGCAREAGFELLLKGAAVENEKDRSSGGSNNFGGNSPG